MTVFYMQGNLQFNIERNPNIQRKQQKQREHKKHGWSADNKIE